MAVTFQVSPVDRARTALRAPAGAPRKMLGRPVEARGSSAPSDLPAGTNAFLGAVSTAFACHYPLALSPDAVWLCIAQAFAAHVQLNAEALRSKLVRHEGQIQITVRRDDFVKGSPENPWPEVFPVFSDAIAQHIGKQRDLVVCDFSTTGPNERAASEIVLMAAMQKYFAYRVSTMCGIPEITLEGTVQDWQSVRRRAQALGEYGLETWANALLPVLDQLVAAASGQADPMFWRSFFKLKSASGGPYVTGWINVFFPYLKRDERLIPNRYVTTWAEGMDDPFGGGPAESSIPAGLTTAPFVWEYLGTEIRMELLAGFVGMAQDPGTLALRPAIGWGVREAPEVQEEPPQDPWKNMKPMPKIHGFSDAPLAMAIAGRASAGAMLTSREIYDAGEQVEEIGKRIGVALECTAVGLDRSAHHFMPVPCRLIIGVRAASGRAPQARRPSQEATWEELEALLKGSPAEPPAAPAPRETLPALPEAVRRAAALDEATWTELAALLPGGLEGQSAVHLVGFPGDDGAKAMSAAASETGCPCVAWDRAGKRSAAV